MLASLRFRRGRLAACALLALAAVACVGPQHGYGHPYHGHPGPKATAGALGGAAAGGLVGAAAGHGHAGPIVAGALIGGLLGGAIGDSLDRADRRYAAESTYRALEYHPSGRPARWRNPDTGHWGSVTPSESYETAHGVCREYRQYVSIDGHTRRAYGVACRDRRGRWRVD